MLDSEKPSAQANEVRRLAQQGLLGSRYRDGSEETRRQLRAGAAEIAAPLVFLRVTRPVERKRGHHGCATGLRHLAHECLDRFHDDVEAVLDDLFGHADQIIDNLEGWLTTRMRNATVDGYRRRRGRRGAPQKPRVPAWLAAGLGHDVWLVELAKAILDWVGTDATAGGSLWPLASWADRRAGLTGEHALDEADVAKDVETVLSAMRHRAAWYEKNVEGPLGRKPAPVWLPARTPTGDHTEPEALDLVAAHERDDGLLRDLAGAAIDLITCRLERGEPAGIVVPEVLGAVFGGVATSHGLDRPPATGDPEPGQVIALISDPARLDRIIASVIGLIDTEAYADRRVGSDRPSERAESATGEGTIDDATGRRRHRKPLGNNDEAGPDA